MSSKASRDAPAQRGQPDDTLQWAGNLSSLPSLRSWLGQRPHWGHYWGQGLLYWLCRKPQSVWNCFIYEGCQSAQSQCLLYLASSDLSVSLLSDVSSFASKSRTDIIRTRLETCSAHIRSPSLTGSVTHSRKKRKRGKNWNLVEFPITWNWFLCDHKGFYLVQQSPPPPQQLCLTRTLGYFSKVRGGRNVIPAQRKRPFSAIKSVI